MIVMTTRSSISVKPCCRRSPKRATLGSISLPARLGLAQAPDRVVDGLSAFVFGQLFESGGHLLAAGWHGCVDESDFLVLGHLIEPRPAQSIEPGTLSFLDRQRIE